MTISCSATGTIATGAADCTVGFPGGSAAGHAGKIGVIVTNSDSGGSSASGAGWTTIFDDGGAAIVVSVLWKRIVGDEGADVLVDFTMSTGTAGVMLVFDGCLASGDVISAVGTVNAALASTTVTANTITPVGNNGGVVFVAASQRVLTGPTCSGYSGTAPTFTEVFDATATVAGLSLDCSIAVALGVQATAAATGSRTATLSAAPAEDLGVMFALKPALALSSAPGGSPNRPSVSVFPDGRPLRMPFGFPE